MAGATALPARRAAWWRFSALEPALSRAVTLLAALVLVGLLP